MHRGGRKVEEACFELGGFLASYFTGKAREEASPVWAYSGWGMTPPHPQPDPLLSLLPPTAEPHQTQAHRPIVRACVCVPLLRAPVPKPHS